MANVGMVPTTMITLGLPEPEVLMTVRKNVKLHWGVQHMPTNQEVNCAIDIVMARIRMVTILLVTDATLCLMYQHYSLQLKNRIRRKVTVFKSCFQYQYYNNFKFK